MATLLIADPHVGLSSPETKFEKIRTDAVLNYLQNVVEEYRPTNIMLLGDLPRRTRRLSYLGIQRIHTMVHSLLSEGSALFVLQGNHDVSEEGSLTATLGNTISDTCWPLMIPQHMCIWNGEDEGSPLAFVALPWGFSEKAYEEEIKKAMNDKNFPDTFYVFGHFGVAGGVVGSDFVMEEGISKGLFNKDCIKHAYLGHYHKRQNVTKRITYVGSPYQITFGEEMDDKFVLLLDSEGKEIWIPTPDSVPKLVTVSAVDLLKDKAVLENRYFRIHYETEEEKEAVWELPGYGESFFVHSFIKEGEDSEDSIGFKTEDFALHPEEVVKTFAAEQGMDKETTEIGIDLVRAVVKESK